MALLTKVANSHETWRLRRCNLLTRAVRPIARKSFTQNLRDFQVGYPILRGGNLERTCYVLLSNSAYRLHLRHFSDHAGRKHGHSYDHTGGLWA